MPTTSTVPPGSTTSSASASDARCRRSRSTPSAPPVSDRRSSATSSRCAPPARARRASTMTVGPELLCPAALLGVLGGGDDGALVADGVAQRRQREQAERAGSDDDDGARVIWTERAACTAHAAGSIITACLVGDVGRGRRSSWSRARPSPPTSRRRCLAEAALQAGLEVTERDALAVVDVPGAARSRTRARCRASRSAAPG